MFDEGDISIIIRLPIIAIMANIWNEVYFPSPKSKYAVQKRRFNIDNGFLTTNEKLFIVPGPVN